MLFSSIPFLYTFLPCVLILYFLVPGWLKNTVLLLSSLFFYAWGEPRFVVFMVIAIVQGYVFGLLAEKFRQTGPNGPSCACGPPPLSVWDFWATASTPTFSSAASTPSPGCPSRCSMWPCPSASAFTPSRF